ncbi:uncharacterized protein CTRU02_212340 [Colletotrichum truncatum]|uniref:Uncharacterized protein n=1 Tax=Colletotrichum truncatum TaxID=5467 RepID=A0ACC3YQB9_COLTU|nr:uncharacterized protein CTRU02_08780 [Colletotrichum truncatum]KAF6789533.1 hypothetical protein CTRU02_08780 [Colletotrichum truncatum]
MPESTASSPASSGDGGEADFELPANFTDTYFFPAFGQLQSEYHVGQPIYEDGETWCLLAEIDAASTSAGNPFCMVCHDRHGDNFIIGFDLSKGLRFAPSQFKIGYTIAVVYAKRHNFLDNTKGIRVADLATCHAFPFKLDELLGVSKRLCDYWDTLDEDGRTKRCYACGKEARKLEECGSCSFFFYCNEDCRKVGWEEKKHKMDCQVLKDRNMKALLGISSRDTMEETRFEFPG